MESREGEDGHSFSFNSCTPKDLPTMSLTPLKHPTSNDKKKFSKDLPLKGRASSF